MAGMSTTSASAGSTPTALSSSLAAASNVGGGAAAYAVSSSSPTTVMAPTGTVEGLASLTTIFHVRWVMQIIGQAFTLPLEDINVVSNATAIYIQWLVEPSKRPPAIQKADYETQQVFLQSLFRHISLLFQPKRVDGVGAAKPLVATLASKHVELCKLMLRTLAQVAIASSNISGDDQPIFSVATWKILLRMLLGVTDYLLRMPIQPYCYLVEELGEQLLSTFMELWLRSQILSATLWQALKTYYPRWTHRMLVITQWSAVSLALTQRITKILYGQGTNAIVYTVYSNLVTLEVSDEYAVYAWHQTLQLIGTPDNLPPQVFFRSVIGMEKLVQVFHSIGLRGSDATSHAIERHFPDGNTILHLFGSWLFEAVSKGAPEFAEGRAQAFGVLCRIFSRPQRRNALLPVYLHQFYAAVIDGLESDLLSLVFIVVNCEDIFALDLVGIRILIPSFVAALQRIIPKLEKPLRVSLNMDDLRRACYKLLCTLFGFCDHFSTIPLYRPSTHPIPLQGMMTEMTATQSIITKSLDAGATTAPPSHHHQHQYMTGEAKGINEQYQHQNQHQQHHHQYHHQYSKALQRAYGRGHEDSFEEAERLGDMRYWIMNILVASFLCEKDAGNLRYLINTLSTFAIDDSTKTPAIVPLILTILQEELCSSKWPVDVCLVAVETIRQLVTFEAQVLDISKMAVRGLVIALCTFVQTLISKNNLPAFFRLIIALFDCILDWVFGPPCASSNWFAYDVESQKQVIQMFSRSIVHGSMLARRMEGVADQQQQQQQQQQQHHHQYPHSHSHSHQPAGMAQSTLDVRGKKNTTSSAVHPTPSIVSIMAHSSKSLESQLASAADIGLAKLLLFFANNLSNPFIPTSTSSLLNECLLLEGRDQQQEGDPLGFVAGRAKKISMMSRERFQNVRYFVLHGSTVVCFVERTGAFVEGGEPSSSMTIEESAKGQKRNLVTLIRTFCGRFSWENNLLYTLDPARLVIPPAIPIEADPMQEATEAFKGYILHGDSHLYAYENQFADCSQEQESLIRAHPELRTMPVHLEEIGPLYNDEIMVQRFAEDDKRLLNFSCIESLCKEQVKRARTKQRDHGVALRNFRARLPPQGSPDSHHARLFLSHIGLTALQNREMAIRLPTCTELLFDLELLDSLPERETLSCAVFYVRSGRQTLREILLEEEVSTDFMHFVHSLGWPVDLDKHAGWAGALTGALSHSMPYYANNDVEINFHVPYLMSRDALKDLNNNMPQQFLGHGAPCSPPADAGVPPHTVGLYKILAADLVTILWVEDLQEMLSLPSKFQTRSIVYICISPLTDARSAGLYRIRIMVTSLASLATLSTASSSASGSYSSSTTAPSGQTGTGQTTPPINDGNLNEAVFLFGPLLDGMIIRRESLGCLVRETAISASLFCLYTIQNQPRPMTKRAQFIQHMINKYRQMSSPAKYYNELIYNVGP